MKANAKKLLALILAMVMCLSLAAPAMATAVDVAAEASLSLQAATKLVKSITAKEKDGKNVGAIVTIGVTDTATPTSTATSTGDKTVEVLFKAVDEELAKGSTVYKSEAVSVTRVQKSAAKIGVNSVNTYTVTPNEGWGSKDQATPIDAEGDDALTLTKDATFKDLSTNDKSLVFIANNDGYMAKGGYYAEKQLGSDWKVFFKLNKVTGTGDNAKFDKDDQTVYAVGNVDDFSATPTEEQLKGALAVAEQCDAKGNVGGNDTWRLAMGTANVKINAGYTYTVMDSDKQNLGQKYYASATLTQWQALDSIETHLWDLAGDTATYQVTANYEAVNSSNDGVDVKAEKDASKVEAALKKGITDDKFAFTLTSVTAGTNGTFNVSVKKTSGYQRPYEGDAGDNTATFSRFGNIVLIDVSKPGTYTPYSPEGKNKEKTSIDAGYKFKSQYYAVKASELKDAEITAVATATDLNNLKDDGWYYFDNRDDMVQAFQTKKCTVTKTVNYKQLLIYVQDGTVKNEGVDLNADGTVTKKEKWASETGAATESGSFTVSNNSHRVIAVKKSKKSTCKTPGWEGVEYSCADCNKVFSTSVEKQLPLVEAPLMKGTKAQNYVWATTTDLHYIPADGHEVVIVKNDKNNTGTVTHKFKCNLGEYHEELEYTEEIKKANLEHSGRWDSMTTSTQNTQYARDPEHLYGYTVYVADTDVEYTNVALLDNEYTKFVFPTSNGFKLQPDGTYTDSDWWTVDVKKLDANGKVVVDGTYTYEAFATLSNIKVAEKDCLDGSATLTIEVYKITKAFAATADARDEAVKKGEAVLVKTHTKDIVVKAVKDHIDANGDGKCDNCGTQIKQVTPDVPTTDKVLTASMVTVKNLTYTGKKQQPEVTVKAADGTELEEGIDYDVATFKKTAVGTYTITVKGKGDWSGKVKATVKIKKAKNPIKVAKTSVAVKAKDVKKKAKTIALKVTKAQGKVTVKSSKKKVVSWKKNKITVAKAAKKGTYKLTFTAKGNKNYKKGTKTVKVVVK